MQTPNPQAFAMIVRIVKLRVVPFYRETDIEAYPSQLNTVNQFIALEESKYFTVKKQAFEEYPAVNAFPPFWKEIKSLRVRDSQLAMRALILNKKSIFLLDDAISMFLPQLFYMAESSTKTLERAQEYASLVLDEKNVTPIKKKRRSFFD
ncbi:hypothetical protein DdX_17442 [Ditylenchus destructor]|uniref:Uncharacterized protein n=1 Tax=Ditylenchus destructor TaxID=166010 RepID=A0AAD4MN10_9BILA|nr:hypothetical protein DdX_17442 [Ditylenchus destructor]